MLSNEKITEMLALLSKNTNPESKKSSVKIADQEQILLAMQALIKENSALNSKNEELQKASKASNSRNTSSSAFSINTLRSIWLLVQTREKLLFFTILL